MACLCQNCGRQYTIDFILPDDIWNQIRPDGKSIGAGLLCGNCIFEKLEREFKYKAYHIVNVPDDCMVKNNRNVFYMNDITTLDIDPDRILRNAIGKLEGVVIAGYEKDSDEDEEYFASSYADGGDALWLLKRFEKKLLEDDEEEIDE